MNQTEYELIIVGAGPASLSAAVYTTREDISTLVLEKGVIGGMAAVTDKIDNYPGYSEGISGLELSDQLYKQAERFGAIIEYDVVKNIKKSQDQIIIQTETNKYHAKTLLLATGTEYKKIDVPGEKEYLSRGVHYCATCDGAFYRGKKIVVVGGGNSAFQETLFLTRYASHIDLLVRSKIRASEVLQKEMQPYIDSGQITVHIGSTIATINGENNLVNSITLNNKVKASTLEVEGVFIFVGLLPNTDFIKDYIKLDKNGFVVTDQNLMTNVRGIFAAGDVRSGATMQIATAVGEGATAALMIREYIEGHL